MRLSNNLLYLKQKLQIMKKIIFLLVAILTIHVSCDSDDDGNVDPNTLTLENLAGTYDVTGILISGTEIETNGNNTQTTTIDLVGSDFNTATFIFTADGSVTASGTFTATTTVIQNGDATVEIDTQDLDLSDSFTLDGNRLIIEGEDNLDARIINFTSEDFQIQIEENINEPSFSSQTEATYTLSRR